LIDFKGGIKKVNKNFSKQGCSRSIQSGQEEDEAVDIQDVVERKGENDRLGERHEDRVAICGAQGTKPVDKQQQKGDRKNEFVPISWKEDGGRA
jgi:hypothetical protein